MTNKNSKIYVAGHRGLVGAALVRNLRANGYNNLVLRDSSQLDLRCQQATDEFFAMERPQYVFLAAARVGGIKANMENQAEFLYENMMIAANVIKAAHDYQTSKLLFLGSSCIYPRECSQPMREEYLLGGYPEPTNTGYALAKIAGLKLCEYYARQYGDMFISCMPTNLYGPGDNFDLDNSHVIPALMLKIHNAKVINAPTVEIWGSGRALREFLHVDDLASACVFLMEKYTKPEFVNVGTGEDMSIADLAIMLKNIIGYKGELFFDVSKPEGTARKLLDVSRLSSLGWQYKIKPAQGLQSTYEWFLAHEQELRGVVVGDKN